MPSTSNCLTAFSGTSSASHMRFQAIAFKSCFQVIADGSGRRRSGSGLPGSNRPVRTLVEAPILDPYLAADELRFIVLDLERVEVFPDQEQPALAGVDMRIDAVQQVLIDDH